MASCANCGSTIIMGGATEGTNRYCNDKCLAAGRMSTAANNIPPAEIERRVQAVHQSACPKCGGPGPVDLHTSHTIWSVLILTRWASHPVISCRSCAKKRQAGHLAMSFFTGWWGFPWGLIMTPVTLGKNIAALAGSGYDPRTPSPNLQRIVRLSAGAEFAANPAAFDQVQGTPPPLPARRHGANG